MNTKEQVWESVESQVRDKLSQSDLVKQFPGVFDKTFGELLNLFKETHLRSWDAAMAEVKKEINILIEEWKSQNRYPRQMHLLKERLTKPMRCE